MHGVPTWIGVAALVAAGCALVIWWAQPRITDEPIHVTPHMLFELNGLKDQLTFGPSRDGLYTGVYDPVARATADAAFSSLIDRLVTELPQNPSKKYLLGEFKRTLSSLTLSDTEDRERAAGYCERIMLTVGVKSSDGVLNGWLYGPILGPITARKAEQLRQ